MGRILRQPLKLIPASARVPIIQGKLRGTRWIVGSSNHGCWLGSYEQEKQELFAASLREKDVVYDIGANVGFYTLLASGCVGDAGRVYAFEPLPRNISFLKAHLNLNSIQNVQVFELALSDLNGEGTFDEASNCSMGRLSNSGSLKVPTATIDTLIAERRIAGPSVIKIDVEGAEAKVLKGARSMLEQHRPRIFLATHGPEVHEECCEFLQSLSYQLRAIGGGEVAKSDELLASC